MPLKIAVLAKQVIDPEMPMAAFRIDPDEKRVVTPPNIPPVVNGFDENAVEAALQIKDAQEATITVISSGTSFALDVMKKPLSMGADELVLLQDDVFENTVDSFFTARLLAEAVKKLEGFDLIICGRQASLIRNTSTASYETTSCFPPRGSSIPESRSPIRKMRSWLTTPSCTRKGQRATTPPSITAARPTSGCTTTWCGTSPTVTEPWPSTATIWR